MILTSIMLVLVRPGWSLRFSWKERWNHRPYRRRQMKNGLCRNLLQECVSAVKVNIYYEASDKGVGVYLQSVFTREAFIAVSAWEWFDCEMYPLVSLQIVVSIEALWALIALKRSVVLRIGLVSLRMAVHLLNVGCVPAVETRDHSTGHSSDKRKLTVWITNVREDWHRVLEWAVMPIWRLSRVLLKRRN